jgi:hypothetical protein
MAVSQDREEADNGMLGCVVMSSRSRRCWMRSTRRRQSANLRAVGSQMRSAEGVGRKRGRGSAGMDGFTLVIGDAISMGKAVLVNQISEMKRIYQCNGHMDAVGEASNFASTLAREGSLPECERDILHALWNH